MIAGEKVDQKSSGLNPREWRELSQTALATAPAEPVTPISPTPLMPSAFT